MSQINVLVGWNKRVGWLVGINVLVGINMLVVIIVILIDENCMLMGKFLNLLEATFFFKIYIARRHVYWEH